jgi:hypothetical protein
MMYLGFRERRTLVDSSSIKQRRRRDLPTFRPPESKTLLPACLILIINECYNVTVMDMVVKLGDYIPCACA